MCVYNGRRVSLAEYIRHKQMEKAIRHLDVPDVPVQYGYDYRDWPILRPSAGGSSFDIVNNAHWEFLPPHLPSAEFHLNFRSQYDTLNARDDNFLTSSLFRQSALTGRCLILSSHFFEHRHVEQIGKRGGVLKTKRKIPYLIHLPEYMYFWMAGICQWTRDEESGESKWTFAIVTTDATEHKLMSQVHNSKMRMPTILQEDLADEWLFGNLTESRIRQIAGTPHPSEEMAAYTVKKGFWNEPDPMAPFDYYDVPELIL